MNKEHHPAHLPEPAPAPAGAILEGTPELDFELLFRHSVDALLVIDAKTGAIRYVNDNSCWLLRTNKDALLGRAFTSLFPQCDCAAKTLGVDQIRATGGVFHDQRFLQGDGSICVADLTATLVPLAEENGGHVVVVGLRDSEARHRAEQERERLIAELKNTLSKSRLLSGLLPICVGCKKIRDDTGLWNQLEHYLRQHSDAEFTHGLCPHCASDLLTES